MRRLPPLSGRLDGGQNGTSQVCPIGMTRDLQGNHTWHTLVFLSWAKGRQDQDLKPSAWDPQAPGGAAHCRYCGCYLLSDRCISK